MELHKVIFFVTCLLAVPFSLDITFDKGTSDKRMSDSKATSDSKRNVNIQEEMGPSGVTAASSRVVSARLAHTASDEIAVLCKRGTLRCCNCGLAVTKEMMLPLRDAQDPFWIPTKPASEQCDYVRVPFAFNELCNPSFEYSDYVACTPQCSLGSMYDNPNLMQSHVPHLFAMMMWKRHRQEEPVNAAPGADCLSYVCKSGISARSFYWILSRLHLIAYKQMAPKYIPPMKDEASALERKDHRFTQYYFQESSAGQTGGPPQVGAKLPAHLPVHGIKLDANPDVDLETDFATDSIHAPTLSALPSKK